MTIGEKIKGVATFLFVLQVIIWCIVGIAIMIFGVESENGFIIFGGLLSAAFGIIIAWILYLILKGFGHLVSNSDRQCELLRKQIDNQSN